jgi:streptogramin lyase
MKVRRTSLALAGALATLLALPASGMAVTGTVTEFPVPTASSSPFGITGGPDGNVWFTEQGLARFGKLNPNLPPSATNPTEFSVIGGTAPQDIIAGPEPGTLWISDQGAGRLFKITDLGSNPPTVTQEPAPVPGARGLAAGPDGDIWVAQSGGDVQRVKTDGTADGPAIPSGGSNLSSIAKGADGKFMWVTDQNNGPSALNNGLIRISTASPFTTTPITIGAGSAPRGVTVASDGRVYFAESATEKIGRVNADGTGFQESSALPTGVSDPEGVAFGQDGNLYVAIFNGSRVGQVAPGLGAFNTFSNGITAKAGPREIAMGADKNMWFTEEGEPISGTPHGAIARLTVDPPPTPTPTPTPPSSSSSGGGGTTSNTSATAAPVLPVLAAGNGASPQVSNLSVSPSRFRVGPQATAVSAASGATGTTITYTLSKAANVKLQFLRPLPGRRKGSRCVAPSRSLRKARRCTRLSSKGRLTRTGQQGTNSVAFSGRIGRKALKPAKYQVAITATDSAGQTSAVQTASFTVLAPKRAKARK